MNKNIKYILLETSLYMNLESRFEKSLLNFIYSKSDKENNPLFNKNDNSQNIEDYNNKILKYMKKEIKLKKDLIEISIELINQDEELNGNSQYLIDKIFKDSIINKDTIDILTILLDFIQTNIFNKNLKRIFKLLDKNNFFTTLLEINKDKETKLDEKIFKSIKDKLLVELKVNLPNNKTEN